MVWVWNKPVKYENFQKMITNNNYKKIINLVSYRIRRYVEVSE